MIEAPNFADLDWLTHGFGLRDSVYPPGITVTKQTHSAIVLDAAGRRGEIIGEGDAIISNQPGVAIGIRTADCVPILLVDVANRTIASIHAGWRGTVRGIARATILELERRMGVEARDLRAAIGPSIGVCCYEVGPDVAQQFNMDVNGRVHLDLAALNEQQLREAGVRDIWKSGECTFCGAGRFYSYRREGNQAGRMVSYIGLQNTSGGPR
jgi:YfiH family protein